jgi:hypothetical protein
MNGIDNPWRSLPEKPLYILPEDASLIADFNTIAAEKFRVRLEVYPEPFLGQTDAPLVVLGLNPGFKELDLSQHSKPLFAARLRGNLLHEDAQYPFYLLDPEIERTKYWERKLRPLIESVGVRTVAQNVLCVEYFPYHSFRFRHGKLSLPSQQYSFSLVRSAINRGAVILMLRGKKLWFSAIPELMQYKKCYFPNSVQNPTVSRRNFPLGFEPAIAALQTAVS